MKTTDFDFFVPEDLIAHAPLAERDKSRLLVWKNKKIYHQFFTDIGHFIEPGSVVVLNKTKVFNCRLEGFKNTGARVEIFLTKLPQDEPYALCEAIGKPIRKLSLGTKISFAGEVEATVEKIDGQNLVLKFSIGSQALLDWLKENGKVPLPPYIKESKSIYTQKAHCDRYQTIYAEKLGSVAAPTAGFHFTEKVVEDLAAKNIRFLPVFLHVGLGTFLPVKAENIEQHVMHRENIFVPSQTLSAITEAKKEGLKVYCVGTTSFRAIEGLNVLANRLNKSIDLLTDSWQETDLFIHPEENSKPYRSNFFDGMVTNFHQPCSTLYMLISALVGMDNAKKIYQEAIQEKYRFFSYGDSSFLHFS